MIFIAPFVESLEKVNHGSLLACWLVDIKHDDVKEKRDKDAYSNFRGTITAIMRARGVDFGVETPLACDNKLHFSAFKRKYFIY